MASSHRSRHIRDSSVYLNKPKCSEPPLSTSPRAVPAGSRLATAGIKAALWNRPEDANLIIRCRTRGDHEVQWKVQRRILSNMSEWMEKYMPPEAEDGSVVSWDLSNWDAGQLGAVLQYMSLEDFQGGVYDANNLLNIESLVLNTVHFLAGTACLCRPMMDQAVDQIDDTTEQVQEKLPLLRLANIDEFEISVRRALLIMYDEPDQWRIRALRIVMGKLMAVCFPLILQSQRWDTYQKWWGMLRVRVVADHKWLYQAGMCQKSDVILSGFENLDVVWVRYRKEGWQPSDDRMFPDRELENTTPAPFSAPPTPAGEKKKSKAIPIIDPCGNIASAPRMSVPSCTGKTKNHQSGDLFAPARRPTMSATEDASPPAFSQSIRDVEDPFTASSNTTPAASVFPIPNTPFGNAGVGTRAHDLTQTQSSVPQPISMRPISMRPPPKMATSLPVSPQRTQAAQISPRRAYQPHTVLPWLPDGPFYFAETSNGLPASKFASTAAYSAPPSVAGAASAVESGPPSFTDESSSSTASAAASVIGESSSESAAASSIDPLDSPTCSLAKLTMAFDEADNAIADEHATPRAPAGNLSKGHENGDDFFKYEATPRAPPPVRARLSEAGLEPEQVNT